MSEATRHIRIVNPNTSVAMTRAVEAAGAAVAGIGTRVSASCPAAGAATVESHVDEVFGALGVLQVIEEAQRAATRERVDAWVIACFGDTGLAAARELADGPVVGMTEAALVTACLVAYRFTVVTLPPRTVEMSDRVIRELGLGHRCTVRTVDVAVADIEDGSRHLLDAFGGQARAAMAHDGAEAVILGCAGLGDLAADLRAAIGIPVIDGVAAAVTMAEGLLAQGLSTSRHTTWAHSPGSPSALRGPA